jgi:hypothetical protein
MRAVDEGGGGRREERRGRRQRRSGLVSSWDGGPGWLRPVSSLLRDEVMGLVGLVKKKQNTAWLAAREETGSA